MIVAILLLINFTIHHGSSMHVTNIENFIKVLSVVTTDFDNSEKKAHHETMIKVLEKFNHPLDMLHRLSEPNVHKSNNNLHLISKQLPAIDENDEGLHSVSQTILGIFFSFGFFLESMRGLHFSDRRDAVINYTVSEDDPKGLKKIQRELHDAVIPYGNSTLRQSIMMLTNATNKTSEKQLCDFREPPQTKICDLYTLIIVSELLGYCMKSYMHCLLEVYKSIDYYENLTIAESEMRDRIKDYTIAFSEAVNKELSVMRRCDPSKHEKGITYAEFNRLRTKDIINQMNLFDESGTENYCNQTCETLDTSSYTYNCNDHGKCDYKNRCDGRIKNCIALGSAADYCAGYLKRYIMIVGSNDKMYGKPSAPCTWKTVSSTDPCRLCLCDCDEDLHKSRSTRSISFREQIADIARNKVVIGVKFHVSDSMLHIQIEQGNLSLGGYVHSVANESNVDWLPLESIEFNRDKTLRGDKLIFDIVTRNGKKRTMIEKQDFGAFTIDQDKINLDYLIAPKNYIITGVRFNYPRGEEETGPIQLEIHVTPFDFFLGKLIIDDDYPSKWLTPDDMRGVISEYDRERKELILSDHLADPRLLGPTKPVSEPNSYIRIQATDLKDDIGQTVLPLIDILEITGVPPFGLGRINLLYKASELRGSGFLSLAMGMVNVTDYYKLDNPNEEDV